MEKSEESSHDDASSSSDVLKTMLGKFSTKVSDRQAETAVQFVKFGIVGVSSTAVAYIVFVGALFALQKTGASGDASLLIAQAVSFVVSVYWSFFWNNRFVFKSRTGSRSYMKSLAKAYASYSITGLFLSSALLLLWVNVLGVSEFLAPLLNLVVTVPINFLLNKFWTFKDEK